MNESRMSARIGEKRHLRGISIFVIVLIAGITEVGAFGCFDTGTWQLPIGSGAKDVRSSLPSSRSFKPSFFSFVQAFSVVRLLSRCVVRLRSFSYRVRSFHPRTVAMEGKKASWRLLISMDSSIIIEMNRLLRQCHVDRIRMTPFMWWVGNDNSFRVIQKLVPFRVVDVLMSLGLEIGGLEIPFNEVVGGLVGEMFKSKTISLKDLTDMFNVIVDDKNIEVDVLNMEWYIRNEDRHRPEIRAAFNMDDGGMSEGSKVEKDDDEDESSDDGAWEAGAEERLRKNNEHIRALNAKIGVLTRELFEIYQTPIFHEEDACATDEEVGGGVGGEENAEVGGEEEGDGHGVGGEENAEVGGEEEGDGNEVDDPLGAHAEVRGDDETVRNINFIEIEDDGDEGEPEVVPLAIPPLRSFVGDPSTSVDVNQLYTAVSIREMNVHRVVSEIIGQSLSTTSIYTLAPMKYVDNMVVFFACTVFMYFEKRLCGVVKRFHFSPLYSHHILTDYRKRPQNRHVFTLHNYNTYLRSDHFGLEELPTADFVSNLEFANLVDFWSMEIFVIDSLGKGIRDRKRIDTTVAENMARFFCILMNIPEGSIGPLTVKQANIPSQPNMLVSSTVLPDYIVMYMGKSNLMLWEELLGIRKKYVCDWILDNDNISRMEALHLYGIV
ncbi:uncharacterized protein HKW66_Vig0225220 [Vigna angularis]|uniref:Aminotransferase-like plant mobile domain-containing protein n=1 Tax=Phaseolus angularis TaxID=3914 RepID=A0A8T0K1V2_PHAAN|nr:uncharacterized protein HKW66_Vig0225220 [Vigna angularis]